MSIRVKWGTPKLDIFLATTLKNLDQKDARYLNQACLKFKLLMDFTHQASPHKSVSHCRQIDAHNSTIYIRTPTVSELKGNSYNIQSIFKIFNLFLKYPTRTIITRGLYTFCPPFELHLCTVTFGLMYGQYSRAVSNQERVIVARVRYLPLWHNGRALV